MLALIIECDISLIKETFMKAYFVIAILFLNLFFLTANEKELFQPNRDYSTKSNVISFTLSDGYKGNLTKGLSKGSLNLYASDSSVKQPATYKVFKAVATVFESTLGLSALTLLTGIFMTAIGGATYDTYVGEMGYFAKNIYSDFYTSYYYFNPPSYDPPDAIAVAFIGHIMTWVSVGVFLVSLVGVIIFEILAFAFKKKVATIFMETKDEGKLARLGIAIPLGE